MKLWDIKYWKEIRKMGGMRIIRGYWNHRAYLVSNNGTFIVASDVVFKLLIPLDRISLNKDRTG